jgi:hypothetical protein
MVYAVLHAWDVVRSREHAAVHGKVRSLHLDRPVRTLVTTVGVGVSVGIGAQQHERSDAAAVAVAVATGRAAEEVCYCVHIEVISDRRKLREAGAVLGRSCAAVLGRVQRDGATEQPPVLLHIW